MHESRTPAAGARDRESSGWARLERDGAVATIVLTAPRGPSRINRDSSAAWLAALREADADPRVRVVIVRAEGRVWNAGGDLGVLGALDGDAERVVGEIGAVINPVIALLHETGKLTVAQVHGPVVGAGIGAMCACDLVVAADTAVFTLGYAPLAATPDAGVTWFLPRILGYRRALELYLTSERLTAARALELGLVSGVATDAELDATVAALAGRLARLSADAVAETKRLLRQGLDTPLDEQLEREIAAFAQRAASDEFAAALAAIRPA